MFTIYACMNYPGIILSAYYHVQCIWLEQVIINVACGLFIYDRYMPVYRQNSERRNPFILSTSSAKKWPYIFLTPRLHLHVLIHVYFENCSISVYVKNPFQHDTHRFRINKLRLCGPSNKGNNCNCYWIAIRISPNCRD